MAMNSCRGLGGNRVIVYFLMAFLFFLPGRGVAEDGKKVVVVAVDRLSLDMLLEGARRGENLGALMEEGALGLLNVATGGGLSSENAYATLGAGTRALGGANAQLAFHREETWYGDPVDSLFLRHYGYPPREEVVFLGLAETIRVNETRPYRVEPGALGEALREAGKTRALIGNGDTQSPRRQSALFLVDGRGDVGMGRVDARLLREDPHHPFGHRLDGEKMAEYFREYHETAHVLLVDWGDFLRLEEYRGYLTPNRQEQLQGQNLEDLDRFLGTVMKEMVPGTLLILFAPTPPRGDWGTGRMMSPVVMAGAGMVRGLLTSATTRRDGIIAAPDIPATILNHLGVGQPYPMLGLPARSLPRDEGKTFLERRFVQIARVYDLRPPVIQAYVTLQVITVLAVLAGILGRFPWIRTMGTFMLSMMMVPLVMLFLTLLPPWPLVPTLVLIYGSAFLLGYFLSAFVSYGGAMIITGLAVSLALSLDLLAGSPLMKGSFLGFDPVAGARYYGIGNEYMGVLVGSSLLFISALLQYYPQVRKKARVLPALYYMGVSFLLAMPFWGANFGGTLTALAAGMATLAATFRRRHKYTFIVLTLLGGVLALALFFWLNLPVPGRELSHWGRGIAAIGEGGAGEIWGILSRKASMGIRLFRYSYWSRVFLSFLFAQSVLLFRPLGILKEVGGLHPFMVRGITGITAGAVVALLTNDSGVVAAATTLLYGTMPLLYLVVERVLEGASLKGNGGGGGGPG